MTTQEFRQLEIDRFIQEHPKMPYPESFFRDPKKYNDKTANGLTQLVIRYIKFIGGQAERISSSGRPIDRTKEVKDYIGRTYKIGSIEWIPSTSTNGTADVSATIKGRSVKVEVKIGNDRMSDNQKKYKGNVEAAGGIYMIAKTFEQITTDINHLIETL